MKTRIGFFSKMSHELRTPLNAIIGYSEILMEELDDKGPDSTRAADIKGINSAGKHLLSLVADVLDSDRIEDERLAVTPTRFTLGTLCDEIVANARPMIAKNGNTFDVHCPQAGYTLFTDARKVRQIAINLLGNAGKFTSGGTVRLEMLIESTSHDDYLRLSVIDTGIGIPDEARSRLFSEYQQADATVLSRFGGTGIGLSLSRQFCMLLGGQIAFESRVGVGSTFTVTLPTQYLVEVEALPATTDTNAASDVQPSVISA